MGLQRRVPPNLNGCVAAKQVLLGEVHAADHVPLAEAAAKEMQPAAAVPGQLAGKIGSSALPCQDHPKSLQMTLPNDFWAGLAHLKMAHLMKAALAEWKQAVVVAP